MSSKFRQITRQY